MSLRTAIALSGLVALVTAGNHPIHATLLVNPSLSERASRTDAIVVGHVESMAPEWDGRRIVTRVRVVREQVLKGAADPVVEVVTPGGSIDGIGMRVIGAAELHEGDRAMFFLSSFAKHRRARGIVDLRAGVMPLERGLDGVDRVRDETGALHVVADLAAELQP